MANENTNSGIAGAFMTLRERFKAAFAAQGVTDPGDALAGYPEKILEIQGDGGAVDYSKNRVRFLDWDGSLVKTVVLEDGEPLAVEDMPALPHVAGVTATAWAHAARLRSGIYGNIDVFPIYLGDEENPMPHVVFKIKAKAGVRVYLPTYSTNAAGHVDWGDGEPVAIEAAESPSHIFETDYEGLVAVWFDSDAAFTIDDESRDDLAEILGVLVAKQPSWFSVVGLASLESVYIAQGVACDLEISGDNLTGMVRSVAQLGTGEISLANLAIETLDPGADSIALNNVAFDALFAEVATGVTFAGACVGNSVYLPAWPSTALVVLNTIKGLLQIALPSATQGNSSALAGSQPGLVKLVIGFGTSRSCSPDACKALKVFRAVSTAAVTISTYPSAKDNPALTVFDFAASEIDVATVNAVKNWDIRGNRLRDWEAWATLFGKLKATTGTSTITIHPAVYDLMPDTVKAVATAKGWTVVAASA